MGSGLSSLFPGDSEEERQESVFQQRPVHVRSSIPESDDRPACLDISQSEFGGIVPPEKLHFEKLTPSSSFAERSYSEPAINGASTKTLSSTISLKQDADSGPECDNASTEVPDNFKGTANKGNNNRGEWENKFFAANKAHLSSPGRIVGLSDLELEEVS